MLTAANLRGLARRHHRDPAELVAEMTLATTYKVMMSAISGGLSEMPLASVVPEEDGWGWDLFDLQTLNIFRINVAEIRQRLVHGDWQLTSTDLPLFDPVTRHFIDKLLQRGFKLVVRRWRDEQRERNVYTFFVGWQTDKQKRR